MYGTQEVCAYVCTCMALSLVLQKLLTKPYLKGSELLYNFLTTEDEFTTSFLPDIKIGNPSFLFRLGHGQGMLVLSVNHELS